MLVFVSCISHILLAPIPVAIYHAFDERFKAIEQKLDEIKKYGFSHIQTSPVNYPNGPWEWDNSSWWMAYQPVKYEIGGRYGNEDDFRRLVSSAQKQNLKIIVDIVFNHVGSVYSNEKGAYLSEGDWRDADRQRREGSSYLWDKYLGIVIDKYRKMINYHYQDWGFDRPEHYRFFVGSYAPWWGSCPSLNLENQYVRDVQKAYLDKLIDIGVEGFRFDALEYIPESAWYDYVHHIGWRKWGSEYVYGELTLGNPKDQQRFLRDNAHATDFAFYHNLRRVFSYGGKLSDLIVPETNGDAYSVTFAETHDTYEDRKQGKKGISLGGDDRDRILATMFVLARKHGVPLIVNTLFHVDPVRIGNALFFRNKMIQHGAPVEFIETASDACVDHPSELNRSKDLFILRRGNLGFMILNRSNLEIDAWFGFNEPYGEMKGRTYKKVGVGEQYTVKIDSNNRTQSKIKISPRDVVFYILEDIYY